MKRYLIIPALLLLIPISGLMTGAVMTPRAAAAPQEKAHGKSLAELLFLYWEWYFKTSPSYGNDPNGAPDHHGKVQFLSIDMDSLPGYIDDGIFHVVGSKSVTLKPDTPFVLPFLSYAGELYLNGVPIKSDPEAAWPLSIITTGYVVATLDGETILNSGGEDDLSDYASGPTFFRKPIQYGTGPQQRDPPIWLDTTHYAEDPVTHKQLGGYAIAAVWAEGVGYYQEDPLCVGTHTLNVVAAYNDPRLPVEFDYTWTIKVVHRGK